MVRKTKRSRTAPVGGKEVQVAAAMLEDLEQYDEQFTAWEKEFYPSICERFFDKGTPLTQPQMDSLKRMHDRLCSGSGSYKKDSVSYNM